MTSKSEVLKGLYVITDHDLCLQRSLPVDELVARAIAGGARLVQYRNKNSPGIERLDEAQRLAILCRKHKAVLLINDDVELAMAVNADGVHLGQTDTGLAEARMRLGEEKIIGITCHDKLELARDAEHEGADYVAFGRFFASKSKPAAPAASIEILREARRELSIPICAIGGITLETAPRLIEQGANMLAVVHDVFAAEDVTAAAQAYTRLFQRGNSG